METTSSKTTLDRVLEIVKKVTGGKVQNINLEGNLRDELTIDSVQIVELFAALENEFNIELPLQLMTARTAKEFLSILETRINSASK
jgi:acyl carrier protein